MSAIEIVIKHTVVHLLIKERHGSASIKLRSQENVVDQHVQRLIDVIYRKYRLQAGKSYGRFEDDIDNYPMQTMMTDYIAAKDNFYVSSCRMMKHLAERAQRQQMTTGGYVLFSHIEVGAHQHMLVAIINIRVGTGINDELAYIDGSHLEEDKLRLAGRIDITAWHNGAERYISFLRVKDKSSGSIYFKQFLGCNDAVVAKLETEKLRDGLKKFVIAQSLANEEGEAFLNQAYAYLKTLSTEGEELSIDTFASAVWPKDPGLLATELAEIEISDGFIPDKRVIKGLVIFEGKTEHWKLRFDRRGIDKSVIINLEEDEITLKNIPDQLRKELKKEQIKD